MQSILIPTDFSRKAQYAANMGFDLARLFNCKIILLHQLRETGQADDARNKLRAIHKPYENIECEIVIESGDLLELIQKFIDEGRGDLVIMGAQGLTDEPSLSLGSVSQKAVRLLDCPVIFVKKPININSINSIVFASNFNLEAQKAFEIILIFAKALKAQVHLLTIDAPVFFNVPRIIAQESMKVFKDMAKGEVDCILHDIPDDTVEGGIINFTEEIRAEMVAIGTYGRRSARIFSVSVAEALAASLDIPVMTINLENKK